MSVKVITLRHSATAHRVEHGQSIVRAYRSTPETIHLQIRWKKQFVGCELTFDQARDLGAHLIAECPAPEPAPPTGVRFRMPLKD
jgi:hypothetical protein